MVVPRARRSLLAAIALGGLGACGGGDGAPHDAGPDAPPNLCGADASFAGEMVDWDSTEAKFCGIAGATWTVRGDAGRKLTTPPNGRLQLCVAHQAQTVLDVVHPTGGSGCPGLFNMPMNTYLLDAVAFVPEAVLAGNGFFSVRAMVQSREVSMEAQIGAPLNLTDGQLYVHVAGTPREVTISATHGATQRFDGTTWAAGATGSDVFFPNVTLGASPVTVSVTGGATGTGSYAVEPGKMTYLTVIAN